MKTKADDLKFCCACERFLEEELFYKRKYRKNQTSISWCKPCCVKKARKRYRGYKQLAVDYMGGKCSVCSYSKYIGALEFHHSDPNEKDPNWLKIKSRSFEAIKSELDKCILVCANCHREIHAKWNELF